MCFFFFFNDTATTEIYTLSLHDALPILARVSPVPVLVRLASHDEAQLARVLDAGVDGVIVPAVESAGQAEKLVQAARSEEHTSELQSPCNLVCRLLLEKKKHKDHVKCAD